MNLPFVSILLPFRNEEAFIRDCLISLIGNGYPEDSFEILAIDGMSSDNSVECVQNVISAHPQIRLLENRNKNTPSGLNIGVSAARGDVLIWVGAHARYAKGYIQNSVVLLDQKGAASVGGVIEAVGQTRVGKAIACAAKSPFGVGNAYYRIARKPAWVDTVFGGCWRKKDVIAIGGFDESWLVNQDYEFNFRLRANIGKIYLSPDIRCVYFVRDSFRMLVRQYFRYGFWRVRTLARHPGSLAVRQLVPPVFVLSLLATLGFLISGYSYIPFLAVLLVYFATATVWALLAKKCRRKALLVIWGFWLMHTAWGTGFLAGLVAGAFRTFRRWFFSERRY